MVPLAELAAVVRQPAHLDTVLRRHAATDVVDAFHREGLAPYVAWLRPDVAAFDDVRRRAALTTALQQEEMVRVCEAMVAAGAAPVLFKGGAWAYTEYPEPWCRPHLDLDVLVPVTERQRAGDTLTGLGYRRADRIPGALVNGQDVYQCVVAGDMVATVDLHWLISNRVWMTQRLPTREVLARAVPALFAAAGARRISDEDGLLVACLHPWAHHAKDPLLKWSLDLALMSRRVSLEAAEVFRARVAQLGASALVAQALRAAGTLVPEADSDRPLLRPSYLDALTVVGVSEPSRAWLNPERDRLQDALDDLRALATWCDRARLLREHLLPPPAFLLARYHTHHRVYLPWLYVWRLVTGGVRWVACWIRDRRVSRSAASRAGDRDV
jgi:hypothetical protein